MPIAALNIINYLIFVVKTTNKFTKHVNPDAYKNGDLLPYLSANFPEIIDPTKNPKNTHEVYN